MFYGFAINDPNYCYHRGKLKVSISTNYINDSTVIQNFWPNIFTSSDSAILMLLASLKSLFIYRCT